MDCLVSEVTGVTHPSNNNQLDYAYSNIEGVEARVVDGFSDHKAIELMVNIELETVKVPIHI